MTDISVSERRLIAALDRLDYAVERAAARLAAQAAAVPPAAPVPEAPLSDGVAALHDRQAATLEALQMRLAEAHEHLAGAGEQAARLAAANDGLASANRALIEAASDWAGRGPDAVAAALNAEIESLRAGRAAEIAQMGEILDALDRMLGVTAPRPRPLPRRAGGGAGPAAAAAIAGEDDAAGTAPPAFRPAGTRAEPAPDALAADALAADEPVARAELVVERDDADLLGGAYGDDPDDLSDPDPDADPDEERR
ncbi:hypothetical protein [Paracoccus luteus]|uniref:hypothetical protein n=1 Tax=Paracoccus luteus TaxID=2508543 RepID=UPI0015F2CC74|nr:hypothetical protein [Paracoccus luteus]